MLLNQPYVRCLVLASAVVAVTAVAARTEETNGNDREQALIAVLTSSTSTKPEKAIACKRLAVFGSKHSVPALASLLNDQDLISWARIALEAIPGPEADEALRKAMGTLQGRSLLGVINSLGVRRDAGAVAALSQRLKDKDHQIASAAAVALGKVGNGPAIESLRRSLTVVPEKVRSAVAEGCILAAERLLADGKKSDAAAIYDEIRTADVPKQRVVEAVRGAILARGAAGIPLLVEQLRSEDKKLFQIGLMTARELPGQAVADAVAAEMDQATPRRAALLLNVLADRGDASASPIMLRLAESGAKPTRIAAIQVLQNSGDTSCVPTLLEIATDDDLEVAGAAKAAIVAMQGKPVDVQIIKRIDNAKGNALLVLIELVGQRQIEATQPLLKAIDHPDAQIRKAALAALGETIRQDDLRILIARVTAPKRADDVPAAEKALKAACIRMPDGDACAKDLRSAMSGAPVATQVKLLEILGVMSNSQALAALAAAAKSGEEALQDVATRLLGETITLDAGPVLLDLAKELPEGKFKIRAIRGYIRLVRQFNMPASQRVAMCSNALKASERAEEQRLVLQVAERYPSKDMLQLAADARQLPAIKADATRATLAIAQKISANTAEVKTLLELLGLQPLKIQITKAEYGAGKKWKDVTKPIQDAVIGLPLITLKSTKYNEVFGDPAPGVVKVLKIQYQIDGKTGEVTLAENAPVQLAIPK